MYCFNCGNEILGSHLFCPSCGTKNNIAETSIASTNQDYAQLTTNSEFNRDVMENYLNNIRILEFAKSKLLDDKNQLERKISSLAIEANIRKDRLCSDDFIFTLMSGGLLIVLLIVNSLLKVEFFEWLFGWAQNIVYFLIVASVLAIIASIVYLIYLPIKYSKEYKKAVEQDNIRMDVETSEKMRLKEILRKNGVNLKETTELLSKIYSLNIIPETFRDLGPMYFIHKNYSTSMLSLEEVMRHCVMDEIKQKIGIIIEQQREMIMELAYSNSLKQQMIEQNNRLIDSAIRNEQSMRRVEQYQAMQTYYAKTNAQIQSYYFYKDGL